MKNKLFILILIAILISLILCGCVQPAQTQKAEKIIISGLDKGSIDVTIDEIKALKPFAGKVEGADSEGKPVVYEIKGGYLKEILEKNGCSQTDFSGMRIVATDDYSIEVAKDILSTRDVILAYEMDGKPLDQGNAPLRIFIPQERAMYWVRMVSELQMLKTEQSDEVAGIYIMDSLYKEADYEDYELIGQKYKTINTRNIIKSYPGTGGDVVLLTASDGLLKNETLENFHTGAINMTGENTPEFFSNELPSGMFVKDLMLFKYGGNAFAFVSKAIEKEKTLTLQMLLQLCRMKQGNDYVLSFKDGKKTDIKADEIKDWNIVYDKAKGVCVYKNDNEKAWDIIQINLK